MKHLLLVLCGLVLCCVPACGSSEGDNVIDPADADAHRPGDISILPDGSSLQEVGQDSSAGDAPEWDFGPGDLGYDWGKVDEDLMVSPDALGNSCSKDSDCVNVVL